MMTLQFQKATRHAVKLKIGVDGPSGSGKTMGALALAKGITNGGKIAVGDSENGSASLYADRFEFDAVSMPDYAPATYREIIDLAVGAGYDALVLDSITHAWQHVLGAKEDYDRANPKSNQWTNWGRFAPQWDALMKHILQAPIHIVATMRSKQAYEQVENNGKKSIVKLGLQPQVRDGAEYEFGIVFSVNIAHHAEATKDRTGLFGDKLLDLCDTRLHAQLVGWMNAGGPVADHATDEQVTELRALIDNEAVGEDVRAKVTNAIQRGMSKEKAADWIVRIRLRALAGPHSRGAVRSDPVPATSQPRSPSEI